MTAASSASTTDLTTAFWQRYGDVFRQDSHFLVVEGFKNAASAIRQRAKETDITGYIVEQIDDFLKQTEEERFDRYSVKEDNPQPGEDRVGSERRRVDILIERTKRPRQKYTFEAKRLERKDHRIGTYTGLTLWKKKQELDGMMRFIRGETYAVGNSEAALIGYIQSDDINYWQNELHTTLQVSSELQRVQGLDAITDHIHPHTWTSQHNKAGGNEIRLYHLFFDCQPQVASSN